jgi:hypothetical protein
MFFSTAAKADEGFHLRDFHSVASAKESVSSRNGEVERITTAFLFRLPSLG